MPDENHIRSCQRCKGDPRACAYCDTDRTDRTDRDARLVVHSHHVCLIVGDDPEPRPRHERLLRSAQDLTRGAREYEEQRWS